MANHDFALTPASVLRAVQVINGLTRPKVRGRVSAAGPDGDAGRVGKTIQNLNTAIGVGKVALAALTGLSTLNADMRVRLTELSSERKTRAARRALVDRIAALLAEASELVDSASFRWVNLLLHGTVNVTVASGVPGDVLTLRAARSGSGQSGAPGQGFDQQIAGIVGKLGMHHREGVAANRASGRRMAWRDDDVLEAFNTYDAAVLRYLPRLAADIRAVEVQVAYLVSINDSSEAGLGTTADPVAARGTALAMARSVEQDLTGQPCGIVNEQPLSLLKLFR